MRTITRKGFIALAASAGAGGLLFGGLGGSRAAAHDGLPAEVTNALEHQTYDMFQEWFSWLRNAGVPGYLGETSVPNSQKEGWPPEEVNKWLTLLDKVYLLIDHNDTLITMVTAHVASHTTTGTNGLKVYGPDRDDVSLDQRNFAVAFEQAAVVEAHPPTATSMRGMNVSAGTFTQSGFSAASPGTYGSDYVYPDRADFEYLRGRAST
jgi:hypothetical protein